MSILGTLGIEHPIIQAPMAGTSTPALAAGVSNAGGLGSIAIGAVTLETARTMIADTRALTLRPFNVNVFTHASPIGDPERESRWCDALRPLFENFGASPPDHLHPAYKSFNDDDAMLDLLVDQKPAVVSFHFGLPTQSAIRKLKNAGITLFASATSVDEARACVDAGIDAIVAQGHGAGGHRGIFDPAAPDAKLNTHDLTRALLAALAIPVIAAGGIMTGRDIRHYLDLGASAAQLGTAFIACPESAADAAYRATLAAATPDATVMTRVISGRPARCLHNAFTRWGLDQSDADVPAYPIAYDAGKALNAAAKAKGEGGYGAQWAGTNAHLSRTLPARDLMQSLIHEMNATNG